MLRALVLLGLAIGVSVAATLYFGQEVLIALGLILTQAKLIAKKLVGIELPLVLAWIKTQAGAFLRVELLKKWITTTVVPMILGKAALRRIAGYLSAYREAMLRRYAALLAW